MLGQAREKFASIAGPQGGTALNGSAMKSEAQTEMEKLEQELATQVAGGRGYTFIIG
jgi:GTPase involved in cell partitioning and DNA repair